MAKKSKLLAALDAHKGRDYDAEKRKKQLKNAEKKKRKRVEMAQEENEGEEDKDNNRNGIELSESSDDSPSHEFEQFETDEEEEDDIEGNTIPQPDFPADASASEHEKESEVSLSDLDEEDREDVVPHQRMTINNDPALAASRKRVAIVPDKPQLPFHYHNSLISTDQTADELIPDPMDDETRELMFYKIARDVAVSARGLLKKEKIPFSRPADYFAEMVKTDDHMNKIKKKLYDEAASRKASEEARKVREAKKFGKQVQIAKEQERAREKRETLGKIKELKRKRRDNDTGRVTEGDDLFEEINVENGTTKARGDRGAGGQANVKRQKKDAKFGFGGKKRFAKSNDLKSSSDLKDFSAKRMKGKTKPVRRLGKNRRAAGRS